MLKSIRKQSYLLKRVLLTLPILFLLPLLTFWLMHLVPGNYFDQLRLNPQISSETIKEYEDMYHLNEPLGVQYVSWLKQITKLNFGFSFAYKRPVFEVLISRFWNTISLMGVSFLFAWLLAVFWGLLSARYPKSWLTKILETIAYIGLSIPNFFLCILLLFGAISLGWLPLGGMHSVNYESFNLFGKFIDTAWHMIIPCFVLGLGMFSFLFRLMRSQAAESLDKDFVLYLRANRISEKKILFKHVLKNSINPLITILGLQLPALVSGAALVEIFTGWPGLGQVMLVAVRTQDLFLVLGNMVMISVLLVLGNLLADILLVVIDPRISLRGENK